MTEKRRKRRRIDRTKPITRVVCLPVAALVLTLIVEAFNRSSVTGMLRYVAEHDMTPLSMIAGLAPAERVVFSNLYAGSLARKIYRIYEFA